MPVDSRWDGCSQVEGGYKPLGSPLCIFSPILVLQRSRHQSIHSIQKRSILLLYSAEKNCRSQSYSTRVSLTSVFVSELSLHLMTGNIEDRQYSIDLRCSTHLACIVKGRDHPVHVGTTRPSFDCWPVNLSCCSPSLFPLSRESKIFKTLSLSAQLMSSISTLQFSISTLDPSPPLSTDISFLTFKHRCSVLFCWIPLHWSTE